MDVRLFHKRLYDAVGELVPAEAIIICAVSGGLDSMTMLHGLRAVNEIHSRRWRLDIAHLDHGLRAESPQDASFVREHAERLGLPFTCAAVDVAAEARSCGESIEEASRRVRYRFLEEAAVELGAAFVAVAHHADDQAETILHRLIRGTGLRGLAGMVASRPVRHGSSIQLIRPLLGFTRADLATYAEQRGIPYQHDCSNDDIAISTRNRIRKEVLPLLREHINPDATHSLIRIGQQALRADEAVRLMAQQALRHVRVERRNGKMILAARSVAALPKAVQSELVVTVLDALGVGRRDMGFERIEAVLALVDGDGRRRTLELPGGAAVIRRGRYVCFCDTADFISDDERDQTPMTERPHA